MLHDFRTFSRWSVLWTKWQRQKIFSVYVFLTINGPLSVECCQIKSPEKRNDGKTQWSRWTKVQKTILIQWEENGKHKIGTVYKSQIWFSSPFESLSRQRCSQVSELVQCGESRDKVKCVLSNGTDDNVLGREWEILTKIQNNTGTVIQ